MSDFAYPLHEECGVFGIYDRAGTDSLCLRHCSTCVAQIIRGMMI